MPSDWHIPPPAPDCLALARELRVAPLVAQLLHNRGLTQPDRAAQFLSPRMADLRPPGDIPSLSAAADHILAAVRAGRKIVLYGDYDVDGVTGVAILWHALRLVGGQPEFYIPHRLEEGYGLSADALAALADQGAQLVISVDCGVTAIDAARVAADRGLDLVITDHHAPLRQQSGSPFLPDARFIVHPGLSESSPNPDLSGAGVAFKLAWAIGQAAAGSERVSPEFRDFLVLALGLAALGTVADVVPLRGENRVIAYYGLRGLPDCPLPGVAALIDAADLRGARLTGFDIGFKLAPRLNAVGRMGHARLAVELLTRAGPDESRQIAEHLEQQNNARRALERRILAEAREQHLAADPTGQQQPAIVLAATGWHAGVIGIVAARLVDEFRRPTVLIALDNGAGQGSARSIDGFALHAALAECGDHLVSHGGHAMAAGLRIDAGRVAAFRDAFCARAAATLTPDHFRARLRLDAAADLASLDESLLRDLDRLEPFGCGNPPPRFASDWLELVGEPRIVGRGGEHLQLTLRQNGVQRKGIAFGHAKQRDALADQRRCRVAFVPILNEFNGRRTVELQISDFAYPE